MSTTTTNLSGDALPLDGFTDELVITRDLMETQGGTFQPISMAFLPDNRMLLLSKGGEILILDPDTGASSSFMVLSNIETGSERGLLDITLDPDFAQNGYFYLYFTPDQPELARISRFTFQENAGGLTSTGSLASETVIWQDTDGYISCCHYGAGLDFGIDGKLWLTTADKFTSTTPGERDSVTGDLPVDMTSAAGKIIRVNPDGTVPDGSDGWAANPWADPNDGIYDYIWGYGLRNPFRARWDAEYGHMFIGEVGGNQQTIAHEDLHLAGLDQAGSFYGWPFYEGTDSTYVNAGRSTFDPAGFPQPDGDLGDAAAGDFFSAPIWSMPHEGSSASLTGGEVYRGDMFPTAWDGVYFYGDYTRDYLRYLILDETGTQVLGDHAFRPSAEIPGTTNEIVSIAVGADGALYYAMIASGEIRRITWSGEGVNTAPRILSSGLSGTQGALPFTVVFSATVTDAEGDPMTWTVNFGDGTSYSDAVGPDGVISVSHTYVVDGRYSISLAVSDPTRTAFSQVYEVEAGEVNDPPAIGSVAVSSSTLAAGDAVTFSATASDPDGDAMTYVWNFGDGNSLSGTVPADGVVTVSHSYAVDGNYAAFLQLSDGAETVQSTSLQVLVGEATEVPVTAGLVLNLQSDIKIGLAAGTTVAAWLDGSGQGNNLFAQGDPQLLAGRTPTGQSAIVFDGVDDRLERVMATDTIFSLPTGNADRTMFFVVKYIDNQGSSAGLIYGDKGRNESFGLISNYRDQDLMLHGWGRDYDFDSDVPAVPAGWLVQSVVLSNDTFTHYLNGAAIDTGTNVFATDLQRIVLGGDMSDKAEGQLEIASVLIYDRALTEAERSQVDGFLMSTYITGTPVANAPPLAVADAFAMDEDSVLYGVDVLADNGSGADADPDGDPLAVSLVQGAVHGALVLDADGAFTYAPDPDYFGADSFVYRVDDGKGGSDTATVTIEVAPVDDPARAVDDAYEVDKDAELLVAAAAGLLANDSDPEGDAFAAALVAGPAHGALVLNPDGSFGYTPVAGFEGTDSFTYAVTGGATATATLLVRAPNALPVAAPDAFAGPEDSAISGDVLADNGSGADADPDGDPLTVSLVTEVAHGTLTLGANGSFSYLPGADVFGTDSFVYAVSDGRGGTAEATVTLEVTPVDDPARAMDDAWETPVDTVLTVTAPGVLANDTDPEGDAFDAAIISDVAHGTLSFAADGSFAFTPAAGFTGTDGFTYAVTGGDVAAVTLTVMPAPSGEVPVQAGLVASWRADENVSLGTGSTVVGLLDGSGRGNDLVALGDPTLVEGATPGGQAAIVFDGEGDLLHRVASTDSLNGLVGGNGDRTLFFVVNYQDAEGVASGLVYGAGARNKAFGLASSYADDDLMLTGWGRANDYDSDVDGPTQGWMVQSVVLSADSFQHYLNGGLIDSGAHVFDTALDRLVIGGEIKGAGESRFEMSAALIYDRALAEEERLDVEAYLQTRYLGEGFDFV